MVMQMKKRWNQSTLSQRFVLTCMFVLLPTCVLYATGLDSTTVGAFATEEEDCNPLEEWVGRRLEKVVMTHNESIGGVIITEVCDDYVRLESTAGGKIYLVASDKIVMLEGRPE